MLNPFPNLLNYGIFAPLLLRLIIGILFITYGIYKFRSDREKTCSFFDLVRVGHSGFLTNALGVVEIIAGVAMILGFATQIIAVITGTISFVSFLIKEKHPEDLSQPKIVYGLICIISISLLLLGAGIPAIDLPL